MDALKLIFRIFLKTLGWLAILAGVGLSVGIYLNPVDGGSVLATLFFFATGVFVPFGMGYILIESAAKGQRNPADTRDSELFEFHLGIALTLYFFVALAVCLPMTGRVVLLIVLLLIFSRVHRDWSARKITTPLGAFSWGDAFDAVAQGLGYLLFQVILALLTGKGSSGGGFGGAGGSSGGGGASGKW